MKQITQLIEDAKFLAAEADMDAFVTIEILQRGRAEALILTSVEMRKGMCYVSGSLERIKKWLKEGKHGSGDLWG